MNNYYDNILIKSAEEQKINYTVIPNLSNYIGNLKKHIPIIGERLELSKLNNYKYIQAEQRDVSFEAINLIKGLIEARVYRKDDTIIYIGDSLTENGYEFYLNDLLKIIPLLIEDIPQHHYFLSQDYTKIIYISFENEIEFGEISSNIHD